MTSAYVVGIAIAIIAIAYGLIKAFMRVTQSSQEPQLLPSVVPYLDPIIGILWLRWFYLVDLRNRYKLPIFTLRVPFQRLYVITDPKLIHAVQNKSNKQTYVANLLDFGMLFSGLNKTSQKILRRVYGLHGNGFTKRVHTYLASGNALQAATRAAIDKLSMSVPNSFLTKESVGLFEILRHELMIALTGAVYGPENPYDDPRIEASWCAFVPGINHLLFNPFPWLTAPKAMRARSDVIKAFQQYFETGGHLQAFPMISESFETNKAHGLSSFEAAKNEIAISLAMLSSGAITSFWLLFHVISNSSVLHAICEELQNLVIQVSTLENDKLVKVVDLSGTKKNCPSLMAVWHETLRYYSNVVTVKKVSHDTMLGPYLLKRDGLVMIPALAIHRSTAIWGPNANTFSHTRFLDPENRGKLGTTGAFRPFGAGESMCPGRHFSSNAILGLIAMIVLQFDVECVDPEGWKEPTTTKADLWNGMPKPDRDVPVKLTRKDSNVEWKFIWDFTNKPAENYEAIQFMTETFGGC